jgi:hypothetical protein
MRPDSGLKDEEAKDEEGYKYTYYYADSDPNKNRCLQAQGLSDVIYRSTEGKCARLCWKSCAIT